MSDHCNEYSRAQLMHQAAARAGAGLPPIERGMPVPAGTGMSRRRFLLGAGGLAMAVYGAGLLDTRLYSDGIAQAAAQPANPLLVSIYLPGGADSLSLLAPVGDPLYAGLRPKLGLPANAGTPLAEDTRLRWHPAAAGLATLHAEGKIAAAPAIGYSGEDMSHFTSRHYWQVGATDPTLRLGWLGRYLDQAGTAGNPVQGLSLNAALSPALATASVPVAALDSPAAYAFSSPGVRNAVHGAMLDGIGALGSVSTPASEPQLTQARATASAAATLQREVGAFVSSDGRPAYSSPVPYPAGDLGMRLAAVAALAAAGLPMRAVTVEPVGMDFDTHSDQLATFAPRLQQVSDSVLAFQRDLEARDLADRVVILLWSEFGRRPRENSSGTDHGAAGSAFVIGSRVKGGLIGEFPGLAKLDANDNLRITSDFRGLHSALLEQWLGHDAASVIPQAKAFAQPALIA